MSQVFLCKRDGMDFIHNANDCIEKLSNLIYSFTTPKISISCIALHKASTVEWITSLSTSTGLWRIQGGATWGNCPPHWMVPLWSKCAPFSSLSVRNRYWKNPLNHRFLFQKRPFDVSHWYCCNLSGGVTLIVWFTTNGMWAKNNNIYAWREQAIVKEIATHDLYCCLLPLCEALRICRSGFPIATVLAPHLTSKSKTKNRTTICLPLSCLTGRMHLFFGR